jgi:hypothetical protein
MPLPIPIFRNEINALADFRGGVNVARDFAPALQKFPTLASIRDVPLAIGKKFAVEDYPEAIAEDFAGRANR